MTVPERTKGKTITETEKEWKFREGNSMKKTEKAWIWGAVITFLILRSVIYVNAADVTYRVEVESGYLALRSEPHYDSRNEIGQLHSGDIVTVDRYEEGDYWWVSAQKLNKSGYVNKNYLSTGIGTDFIPSPLGYGCYGVRIETGYLALRNFPENDPENEIGKMHNGDTVDVIDTTNTRYWWVYSYANEMEGFVNKDCIYKMSVSEEGSASKHHQ